MANIKPFKAIYYNPKKIKDLSKVVSPPYDVISPEEQDALHGVSPYNFTHIDFGKDMPNDDNNNNKYTRSKRIYTEWLDKEILIQDEKPCVYFYRQDYKIMGQKRSRMGFISLMELENSDETKVYPHENTHSKAIDDRLRLCESLKAYLSSIFVCYSDRNRKIEKIFNRQILLTKPMVDVEDNDKVRHKLWRLDDPKLIAEMNASLSGQHLFIADGHHRYKVAVEYRAQRLNRMENSTGQEPFNYVMTYFTNMDSTDLQIFPMHRIIKSLPGNLDFLDEFFRIDRIKKEDDLLILLAQAGRNEHAFGLYAREGIKLLRLKNRLLIDEFVKEGSQEYKNLDAVILKSFVFDRVGLKSDDIQYTKSMDEVTEAVGESRADAGFILNPVKIAQLRSIALNGERMPPKTTYFYPKLLSGLTVYKMG
ncbi:MAG: DUF1015 domain-containing protein [Candidatus Omnitrophica bacterium]|nr:DUF1015 domain-containing protein [Candidatus Omnitrophota bacterium]